MVGFGADVGPLEQHLQRVGFQAGAFQHERERHAGPLGMADGAGAPLHAGLPLGQKRAAVAGALDRGEDGALGQVHQFVPRPRAALLDAALDAQAPGGEVERRHREVIADEEQPGRRDPAPHAVQRRLAVLRLGGDDLALLDHQLPLRRQEHGPVRAGPRRRQGSAVPPNTLTLATTEVNDFPVSLPSSKTVRLELELGNAE